MSPLDVSVYDGAGSASPRVLRRSIGAEDGRRATRHDPMSDHEIQIETIRDPESSDTDALRSELRRYNRLHIPLLGYSEFAVFARADDGRLVGGIIAETGHGWLHISTAWVDERE